MIRTSTIAALFALSSLSHAALTRPGDLAFTAFNADEDGFAIVALAPIGPATAVFFTDNEWPGGAPGTATFTTGESTLRWVSGNATIPAGTVVRFSAIDHPTRAASVGSLSVLEGTSLGFAATGDTLFAYAGFTHQSPQTFFGAISTEDFAGSDLAGTGLVQGKSAVAITAGADFGQYTGPRAGMTTFAAYAPLVNDAARWTAFATGSFAATVPDVTAFTTGAPAALPAVPEPATYATLLAGLGLLALRLDQRRRRGVRFGPVVTRPRALPASPSDRAGW